MEILLGVDIGTQGAKAVLLNEKLDVIGRVYQEHDLLTPNKPGQMEQNADAVWWAGFKKVVKKILEKTKVPPADISIVACSAHGPDMLPVSKENIPIRPALLYGDTRGEKEVTYIIDTLGRTFLNENSKNTLSTQHTGPKILWYKNNESENYKKTTKVFTASNYITYKLTDNFVIDYGQASLYNPFFNYGKRCWDHDVIRELGVSDSILPEIKKPTEIIGTITKKAAAETGLKDGTRVSAPTIDGLAEPTSIGGFRSGAATLLYGTASSITITTKKSSFIEGMMLVPSPVLPDHEMVVGATATAGALNRWFRDNFGYQEKKEENRTNLNAYELLSKQAKEIPPGSEGLITLPYFSGERTPINDNLARGMILGLTTYHTRAHIYRALLEASAYAFKDNFETIRSNHINIAQIISSGGGTNDLVWVQIVSDVLGEDQILLSGITGAEIGAAYMAGLASGIIENLNTIEDKIKEGFRTVNQNKAHHAIYEKYFTVYRSLYRKIKEEMHTLAYLGSSPY